MSYFTSGIVGFHETRVLPSSSVTIIPIAVLIGARCFKIHNNTRAIMTNSALGMLMVSVSPLHQPRFVRNGVNSSRTSLNDLIAVETQLFAITEQLSIIHCSNSPPCALRMLTSIAYALRVAFSDGLVILAQLYSIVHVAGYPVQLSCWPVCKPS